MRCFQETPEFERPLIVDLCIAILPIMSLMLTLTIIAEPLNLNDLQRLDMKTDHKKIKGRIYTIENINK